MNKFARLASRALLLTGMTLPLGAYASLIGDEVSVEMDIQLAFSSSTPTLVFDESVVVVDGGGPELSTVFNLPGDDGSPSTLTITLDFLAEGFVLDFECSLGGDGCEFGYDRDFDFNLQDQLGFRLNFSDLDWVGSPGSLTGVDLEFGGNFVPSGDDLIEFDRVLTANSYAASFSGSALGTGGPSFSASVTGEFTVVHDQNPLPVPGAAVLVGVALGLLGLFRRGNTHARRR